MCREQFQERVVSKQIAAEFQILPSWALERRVRALEKQVAALESAVCGLRKQSRSVSREDSDDETPILSSGNGQGVRR